MSDSLGSLVATLGLDTSSLSSAAAKAKGEFASIGESASSAFGPIGALTVGAAAAVVGLGAAAFAVGEKFQGAYNKIQVGTRATGTALQGLKASFNDVLSHTAGNFDQVSAAITTISDRTGLTGKALDDLATKEVNLGRITKTDVGENVQATTALFNLYGIAASDQSGKLDELFKASQIAGTSVADLTSQVQAATPVAKALGLSFEQTTALTANLTQAGLPASKVMQGLGKEFTAAAKAGKDPLSVISDLEAKIKAAPNDTDAAAIAFQAFGVRAGPQLSAALRSGKFDLQATLKTITDGRGGINATATDVSTLGGKFARLKNEALVAIQPIGSELVKLANEGIGKLITVVPGVISEISHLGDVFKFALDPRSEIDDLTGIDRVVGTIAKTLMTMVADFKAAWPEVKRIVGETLDALKPVFDFIDAHAKPILTGLGIALVALVDPFAVIDAGLVYAYQHFEAFRDAVDATAKFLVNDVVPAVVSFAQYVRKEIGDLVTYIVSIWPQVSEAVGHVMTVIRDLVGVELLAIRTLWDDWGHHLLEIATAVWDQVKDAVSTGIRIIRDTINLVLALINGDWGKAWDALKDIPLAILGLLRDGVDNGLQLIKSVFDGLMNEIKTAWDAAWGAVRDTAKGALRDVVDFFLQAAIDITGAGEKAFGWVPGIGGKLRSAHDDLVKFKDDVNSTLSDISNNPVNVTVYAHLDDSQARAALASLQADASANPPDQSDTSVGGNREATGGVIPAFHGLAAGIRRAASGLSTMPPGGGRPVGPTLVSEAGFNEWVITPDIRFRNQNLAYLGQAAQALGVAPAAAPTTIDYDRLAAAMAGALAANPIVVQAIVSANAVSAGQRQSARSRM